MKLKSKKIKPIKEIDKAILWRCPVPNKTLDGFIICYRLVTPDGHPIHTSALVSYKWTENNILEFETLNTVYRVRKLFGYNYLSEGNNAITEIKDYFASKEFKEFKKYMEENY